MGQFLSTEAADKKKGNKRRSVDAVSALEQAEFRDLLDAPELGALLRTCRRLRIYQPFVDAAPLPAGLTHWFPSDEVRQEAWTTALAMRSGRLETSVTKLVPPTKQELVPHLWREDWFEEDQLPQRAGEHAEELLERGFLTTGHWRGLEPYGVVDGKVGALIDWDDYDMEGCHSVFFWDLTGKFSHSRSDEQVSAYGDIENCILATNHTLTVTCSARRRYNTTAGSEEKYFELKINHTTRITVPYFFYHTKWVTSAWSDERHRKFVVGIGGPPTLLIFDTCKWILEKTIVTCSDTDDDDDDARTKKRKLHVIAVDCCVAPDGSLAIVALVETDDDRTDGTPPDLQLWRDGVLLAETPAANFKSFVPRYGKIRTECHFTMTILRNSQIFLLNRDATSQPQQPEDTSLVSPLLQRAPNSFLNHRRNNSADYIQEYALHFTPRPSLRYRRTFRNDRSRHHQNPPRIMHAIHDILITTGGGSEYVFDGGQENNVVFWDTSSGTSFRTISMNSNVVSSWLTVNGLLLLKHAHDGTGAELLTLGPRSRGVV